ncbi:MAG: FCD domain-containing protein, partial [Actinomycetota bacterium]
NVPGCPIQPDNLSETFLYLLYQATGQAPMIPLDEKLRPTWLFGATVHEGCDRAGYYELVERMDQAIDDAAANPYLAAAQRSLRLHLARVRKLSRTNPERLVRAAAEHAQIARAVAEGAEELAEAATRVHLANSLHAILTTPVREWVQPAPPLDAAG